MAVSGWRGILARSTLLRGAVEDRVVRLCGDARSRGGEMGDLSAEIREDPLNIVTFDRDDQDPVGRRRDT